MKLDTHPIFFICYIKEQGRYTVFEYQHKVTALSLDFILIKSMSCFFLGSFKNQAFKFFFQKWQFNSVQSQSLVQKMSRSLLVSDLNSGSVWDWWPMLCHRFKVLCNVYIKLCITSFCIQVLFFFVNHQVQIFWHVFQVPCRMHF